MIAMVQRWFRRLGFFLSGSRRHSDLDSELSFHLEEKAADLRGSGLSPTAAAQAARQAFGNRGQIAQDRRDAAGFVTVDAVVRDVRLALRSLRRVPGFTIVALITLGLGIGGTTAIFSMVYAALLAPLPYPAADRLVNLHVVAREDGTSSLLPWSYPKFAMLAGGTSLIESRAGFSVTNVSLRGEGEAERVILELASAGYLEMLGARPVLGRFYRRDEDSVGMAAPVVVISHRLWRQRFGADSGLVGRAITLGAVPLTVVGVAGPGFRSLSGSPDLWAPLSITPSFEYAEVLSEAGNYWLSAVGRLVPGTSLAAANQQIGAVGAEAAARFPMEGSKATWTASVTSLDAVRVDPTTRRTTLVLLAAVGLLLLIANANVAGLLLVRAVSRNRELAIRAAVGAGSGALFRQLVVEGIVLGALGGAAGVLIAEGAVRALVALSPPSGTAPAGLSYLFDLAAVNVNGAVLAFAAVITAITGVLVGLVPALRARTVSVADVLKGDRDRGRRPRGQAGLISFEAALAVILLVGAGLMIRSFARLSSVNVGFDGSRVLTFRVSPTEQDRATGDPMGFKADVLAGLRAIPGVVEAGVNVCAPLTAECYGSVTVARGDQARSEVGLHFVDAGYFATLRIPLRSGRWFGPEDRPGTARVVVVNETAARRLWPGQDPIGKQLAVATGYFFGGDSTATVVGVAGDVRYAAAEKPSALDVYLPALQRSFSRSMFFVRTSGDPSGVVESARRVVRSVDAGVPIFAVRALDDITAAATAKARFLTVILTVLSSLALVLAAVGIYGVVAFAVRQRAKEISIRLAIGAAPRSVIRLLVRQGVVPVVIGLTVGLAVSVVTSRVIAGLLFEVGPRDLLSFGGAVSTLLIAGVVASWIPARRAARASPVAALKDDR